MPHSAAHHVNAHRASYVALPGGPAPSRRDVHPRPPMRVTYNWPAIAVALGAFLIGMVVGMAILLAVVTDVTANRATLPPCPTEDSVGCYRDAETMGNGRGHDVVTIPNGYPED